MVQSMPDVSPTKWHLAHVSWFFETFVLKPHLPGYRPMHPEFEYLFNSYYNSVGRQFDRPQRGLLTRPTLDEVLAYRSHVDLNMQALLAGADIATTEPYDLVELGLQHEQQHQELILMDIKHVLSRNPLHPAYTKGQDRQLEATPAASGWLDHPGGVVSIGHQGAGFCFDNEHPVHDALLAPFRIATRLVTNGEYLQFIEDEGYDRAKLWLADGWTVVGREGWRSPLYWTLREDRWWEFSLEGLVPLDPAAPVVHVSYYEASAYAEWAGCRLAEEREWEVVARDRPVTGNFVEEGWLHPRSAAATSGVDQLFGDVWEWTRSPYVPYPGFRSAEGAIGEYNGKFMCNQLVLRGGCCVSPASHLRATYRNFFYPHCRWQFSGIRLARDV